MSEAIQTYPVSDTPGFTMLKAMVGIGIICALCIVLTFEGTRPVIEEHKAAALERAIFEVLPGAVTKRTYVPDSLKQFVVVNQVPLTSEAVYAGYDSDGNLVGVAIEASGIGFADLIRILYGYDPGQQAIIGFHVLESKETPGLGDKIEKDPAFRNNFNELDVTLSDDAHALLHAIRTVKHGAKHNSWEIDGITGATISSRAIGTILDGSTGHWIPRIYRNKTLFESSQSQ